MTHFMPNQIFLRVPLSFKWLHLSSCKFLEMLFMNGRSSKLTDQLVVCHVRMYSGMCAIAYFVFGCLCLDRFTSRAFLSTNDPVVSTAIPRPTTVEGVNLERSGAYHSPRDP